MDSNGSEFSKLDEEATEKNDSREILYSRVSKDVSKEIHIPSTGAKPKVTPSRTAIADNTGSSQDEHEPNSLLTLLESEERKELRLILVGKTGTGKSATGNTILGLKDYFESKISSKSVTSSCLKGERRFNDRIISIVDTPGICDTNAEDKTVSQEIVKCVAMSLPGPHAFLLIVQAGRFTKEEDKAFCDLFDLFGYHMERFVIVVFTRLDDIEDENSTIHDFVKSATPELQSFLEKCNNRYFAINNKAGKHAKINATIELMRIVNEITDANRGQHYTNQMYMEAEEQLRNKILEAQKKKEQEKKEIIAEIESKYHDEIQEAKTQNKELEKQISDQEQLKLQIQADQIKSEKEIRRMQDEIAQAKTTAEWQQKELERQLKVEQAEVLKEQERQKQEIIEKMLQEKKEADDKYMEMAMTKDEELRRVHETYQKAQQDQVNDIKKSYSNEIQSLTAMLIKKENENFQQNEMLKTQLLGLTISKEVENAFWKQQLMVERSSRNTTAEKKDEESSCVVM